MFLQQYAIDLHILAAARMAKKKSPPRRGGSRNKCRESINLEHLCDQWLELHQRGFDLFGSFGEYEGLWTECAPRPAIADLIPLVKALALVSPGLLASYGDLKEAASMCMLKEPSCKPKKQDSVVEAAKFVGDKLVIVQKHFRAIALNQGVLVSVLCFWDLQRALGNRQVKVVMFPVSKDDTSSRPTTGIALGNHWQAASTSWRHC